MRRNQDARAGALLGGRWRSFAAICAIVLAVSVGAIGQGISISGRYGLDTMMLPIPATLVSEIQLNTPAELTLLKFGIESKLDLTVTYGSLATHLNTAMNIPGWERFIFDARMPFAGAMVKGELWFAVPFETVTDVNHFQNWVIIPPGDVMFVTGRLTAEFMFGGLDFHNLLMIEDVTFPNPSLDFGPLQYPVQSQSFHVGDILTFTAEPYPGVTLKSVTYFWANAAATAVKGWSAPGSVDHTSSLCDEFAFSQKITLTGLEYCGVPYWFSLQVNPCQTPTLVATGGGSFSNMLDIGLSGSFSFFPLDIGGFSFSAQLCDSLYGSFSLNEHFQYQGATFRCSSQIDTGLMKGTVASTFTFRAGQGCTNISFSANLMHGTFSGGVSGSISQQAGNLKLTSVSWSVGIQLSPVTISVSAAFGAQGLARATLSLGVVF